MIFVDTNVIMHAVGRSHPLRGPAREFFLEAHRSKKALCTSAEVLQELLHVYLPVDRKGTLESALRLALFCIPTVWPIEQEDVLLAYRLVPRHPGLSARDLLHLACCQRRGVENIQTFDRGLRAALGQSPS